MAQKQYVRIGKIINTHGNRGELKINSTTDFPAERFAKQAQVFIKTAVDYQAFIVEQVRPQQRFWLLKLMGIDDLNQAEKYKGLELFADTSVMPSLEEGQYFYKDIMGIKVQDAQYGELGQVVDIMNLGPNDVWNVRNQQGQEILIPILKSTLKTVDLDTQTAYVDLPEGLIDEN
ncbi:ribosome maturation factor RimM [Bombilactobacillus bombi]|uniref:ribosome maturation factor RimM n=1 Tax=Bombilactobacillus bombi TaxID=1303590 RepID=UPI0015E5D982|nr:ribosome maturation factor RimM [Bombilactobacillus bombi]MBA1434719.1 ribosome maturation factor RimM [Bombilactobacillus bombi]